MLEKVEVMIVEDNEQLAESMSVYFESKNNISVTGIASNAFEAIELLKETIPDTIILDLVMPQADGFVLLQYLLTTPLKKKPQVIVLSAMSNEIIMKKACDMGAIYYVVKPFALSILYERIISLAGLQTMELKKPSKPENDVSMDEQIATILLTTGIPSHKKGYRYLYEGVRMLINNPDMVNNKTKRLYPEIGIVFNTTAGNVERAIRTALDSACNSGKFEKINVLYGQDIYNKNDKVTSSEVLSLVANKVLIQKN